MVVAGAFDHCNPGDMPKLSQVYNLGYNPLFKKPFPLNINWLAIIGAFVTGVVFPGITVEIDVLVDFEQLCKAQESNNMKPNFFKRSYFTLIWPESI